MILFILKLPLYQRKRLAYQENKWNCIYFSYFIYQWFDHIFFEVYLEQEKK